MCKYQNNGQQRIHRKYRKFVFWILFTTFWEGDGGREMEGGKEGNKRERKRERMREGGKVLI